MCVIEGLSRDPSVAYEQGRRDGRAETLHAAELAATDSQKTMGIFGGVFDPPHYGHLFLAETLKKHLDEILFVPCGEPPHKKPPRAPKKDRRKMTRLAVNKRFPVSDIELNREGYSYTIDTLRDLQGEYGSEYSIVLLIGGDNIQKILSWKDYLRILSEFKVVAINRPGCYLKPRDLRFIQKHQIEVIKTAALNISSTIIRKRIEKGLPIRYLIPDKVLDYIMIKGLYGMRVL